MGRIRVLATEPRAGSSDLAAAEHRFCGFEATDMLRVASRVCVVAYSGVLSALLS